MYTLVDFTSQIVGRRGSLVPQTRGSHTPIWCAGCDLKNRLCLSDEGKWGPLSHKQGGLIHQFGALWRDLKNRLCLSDLKRVSGVPCPTNKGVSYTNLVCWLGISVLEK
jgi:hypothetical protein